MTREGKDDQRANLRGDEGDLVATYGSRLREIVSHDVSTAEVNVEDACAFAWLQLTANQPRRETVFPWLIRVAIREAWRLDRIQRRDEGADEGVLEGIECPTESERTEARLTLEELIATLATLHPRKRKMLLQHAAGYSVEEIAAEHGISRQRARELIYRARLQLKQRLGRGGIDPRERH